MLGLQIIEHMVEVFLKLQYFEGCISIALMPTVEVEGSEVSVLLYDFSNLFVVDFR